MAAYPVKQGSAFLQVLHVMGGTDGTNVYAMKVDTDGNPQVDVVNTPTVDTELPTAAALADGASSTPTTPTVGAVGLGVKFSNSAQVERLRTEDIQLISGQLSTASSVPGILLTHALLLGHDGSSTWTRIRATTAGTDALTPPGSGVLHVQAILRMFNGSTLDRVRGNTETTLLSSSARTSTTATSDQTNYNARGVQLTLDITATPNNAETLTVELQVKDPVSAKYTTITAFTALVASALGASPTTATYVYTVYPGAVETAAVAQHEVQGLPVPRTWRARVVHSSTGSWTYSLAGSEIL